MSKVSVVIPAYNCEKFIEHILNCVKLQSYTDYEVIIVNDGSTDKTAEIVRNFCDCNEKFTLINQENEGPASTRNTGLLYCRSEYIIFLDADDDIPGDYIETLIDTVTCTKSDLAVCSLNLNSNDRNTLVALQDSVYNSGDYIASALKGMISPIVAFGGPVCKIYRKNIIRENGITFKNYRYGEDTVFNLDYILHCNSISTTGRTAYTAIAVEGSLSKNSDINRFNYYNDLRPCFEKIFDRYISDDSIKENLAKYYTDIFLARAGEILNSGMDKGSKITQLDALIKSNAIKEYDVLKARGNKPPWYLLSKVIKIKSGKLLFVWFVLAPKLGV